MGCCGGDITDPERHARLVVEGRHRFAHLDADERETSAHQWATAMERRASGGDGLEDILVAADPYGRGVPSRVPRPTGSGGGSSSPPAGIPPYLKPIPVNVRNIDALLRAYLTSQEPQLRRWLYSTWTAQADALKYQELRNAIVTGQLSEDVLAAWRQQYSAMIVERLEPAWRAAASSAHGPLSAALRRAVGSTVPFEATAARLDAWIAHRGAELVVDITATQRGALQAAIRELVVERPVGARELGRYLRPIVGLTERQSIAVMRRRAALVEQGVDPKLIERQVQNYAGYQARVRAERIARTEIAFAFNQSQIDLMRTAQAEGAIESSATIYKELMTANDERTCPFCGPLNGTTIGLEETFPGVTGRLPNVYMPPLHPSCRCTTRQYIVG